jgi:hypothetical protein
MEHTTIAELLKDVPRGYKVNSTLFYNTVIDGVTPDMILIKPEKDNCPIVVLDADGKMPGSKSSKCIISPEEVSDDWTNYRYFRFDYGMMVIDKRDGSRHCIIKRVYNKSNKADDKDYYRTIMLSDGFSYITVNRILRQDQMSFERIIDGHFFRVGDVIGFTENYSCSPCKITSLIDGGYELENGKTFNIGPSFSWHTPFSINEWFIKEGQIFVVRCETRDFIFVFKAFKNEFYGIGKVMSQFTIDMDGKLSDEFEFSECDGYRPASEEEKNLIKDVLKKEHKSINDNGVVDYSGPVRISHIEYGHKSDIIIKGVNTDKVDGLIKYIKKKL